MQKFPALTGLRLFAATGLGATRSTRLLLLGRRPGKRRLAAAVAEGVYADLISAKDRLIENKEEQLRKAETLVLARDERVQQAEAQKAGLRSALDQAEAELARIRSSRSWRLVSRLGRLSGLAAR